MAQFDRALRLRRSARSEYAVILRAPLLTCDGHPKTAGRKDWVAVKELKLSYYIGKPYYLLYIPILVT